MLKRITTFIGWGVSSLFFLGGIASIASGEQLTESSKPATYIMGKNCSTTVKFPPEPPKATPCRSVTVTGLDDLESPLYFYFMDEFGAGMVFVTERLTSNGKMAKIKAIGSVMDRKIAKLTKIESPTGSCVVNYGEFKVACLYQSAGAVLIGQLEDF